MSRIDFKRDKNKDSSKLVYKTEDYRNFLEKISTKIRLTVDDATLKFNEFKDTLNTDYVAADKHFRDLVASGELTAESFLGDRLFTLDVNTKTKGFFQLIKPKPNYVRFLCGYGTSHGDIFKPFVSENGRVFTLSHNKFSSYRLNLRNDILLVDDVVDMTGSFLYYNSDRIKLIDYYNKEPNQSRNCDLYFGVNYIGVRTDIDELYDHDKLENLQAILSKIDDAISVLNGDDIASEVIVDIDYVKLLSNLEPNEHVKLKSDRNCIITPYIY